MRAAKVLSNSCANAFDQAFAAFFAQPQLDRNFSVRRDGEFVLHGSFGAFQFGIHCRRLTVDHVTMKRVLYIRRSIFCAEEQFAVGFIFGEQGVPPSA